MNLTITSPAFAHNGSIPIEYTCDGEDISPPLIWSGVPAAARSLILIVDDPDAPDPDAPRMTWVHWILYNLPPTITGLSAGILSRDLPPGTLQGVNSWQRTGYGGPCPPVGRHRYIHKLYALNVTLSDLKRPAESVLEQAMRGHILAQCELIGMYQRQPT